MANNPIMIMGTSPGAGKTVLTLGLCRYLANLGVKVAPYKAISVISFDNTPNVGTPLAALGTLHACRAARRDFKQYLNPVTVWPTGPTTGDLYLYGKLKGSINLLNSDNLVYDDLSDSLRANIQYAVGESLDKAIQDHDVVIIEGAGSPTEVRPEIEIPNIYVSRVASPSVLLCAQFAKGGSASALIGTVLSLPPDVRERINGFVLSNVRHQSAISYTKEIVEDRLGIHFMGVIPAVPTWDGLQENRPSPETSYEQWARAVEGCINLNALPELLGY